MKNTISDLNNHLFEQMERLMDEDLTTKELEKEIKRSKAVVQVASAINNNGKLAIQAERLKRESTDNSPKLPDFLRGKDA